MDRPTTPLSPEIRGISLSLAATGTALVASAAFAVCAARLGGPFDQPLPSGVALAAMLLTAAWCASIRAAWLAGAPHPLSGQFHGVIAIVPFCSALLLVRAVTFAPLSEFSTFLLWFATLAEEAITLGLFGSALWSKELATLLPQVRHTTTPSPRHPQENTSPTDADNIRTIPTPADVVFPKAAETPEPEEEATFELPAGVTQQLTRATEEDQEQIHGLVRANFEAGQRHAYLHLGFCPPLPCVPHVELHQMAGPEVQIKTGQVLTSGVRFDLKLRNAPAANQSAVFEFLASSPQTALESQLRSAG